MLELLKRLQFKRDPRLIIFSIVLVLATAGLILHGDVSAKEGFGFLMGALAMPGLFGAAKTDDTESTGNENEPPPSALPTLALAFALAMSTTGCAFLQQHGPDLVDIFARKATCALEHMNFPNDEIIRRCTLQPGDLERILSLVGTARSEAAKEASAARNDERARLQPPTPPASSACADAGAP